MPAAMLDDHPHSSHYVHLFPNNPYSTPPSRLAHKVWILDCRACGKFFTNRAMKVVLLLRQNVSLYSSDTLPANCSVFSSDADVRPPFLHHKTTSVDNSPRICECLTQTFCCHGCGNVVGYVIVIACKKCTASITATNRPTNGHRFVFHSSDVIGTERHYIEDEPGVMKFDILSQDIAQGQFMHNTGQEHIRTNPWSGDLPSSTLASFDSNMFPLSRMGDISFNTSNYHLPTTNPTSLNGTTTEQKEPSVLYPCLRPGDALFWHHLSRSGEIPGVEDDRRSRSHLSAKTAKIIIFDR